MEGDRNLDPLDHGPPEFVVATSSYPYDSLPLPSTNINYGTNSSEHTPNFSGELQQYASPWSFPPTPKPHGPPQAFNLEPNASDIEEQLSSKPSVYFDCPYAGCDCTWPYGFRREELLDSHIQRTHVDRSTIRSPRRDLAFFIQRKPTNAVTAETCTSRRSSESMMPDFQLSRSDNAPIEHHQDHRFDANMLHGMGAHFADSDSNLSQGPREQPLNEPRNQTTNKRRRPETDIDSESGPVSESSKALAESAEDTWFATTRNLLTLFQTQEPPIEAGKQRARWTCVCGHSSYDDFRELRAGAVNEYEELLRTYLGNQRSPGYSERSDISWNILQLFGRFSARTLGQSSGEPTLPQHDVRNILPPNSSNHVNSREALLFVLLCLPFRGYATKLLQPGLEDVRSDQVFFKLLRRNHISFKGTLKSWLSLKTLRAVKFVHFEMFKSDLVDIRSDKGEGILPSAHYQDEYYYRPLPAEAIPPIGENLMVHLCSHPQHADSTSAILMDRVPKWLRERLYVDPTRGTGLGWGIRYIEGWHLSLIWLLSFFLLLLASVIFLICWAVLQHDVQGASGVATYVLALITLFIGSLQAAFEMELL